MREMKKRDFSKLDDKGRMTDAAARAKKLAREHAEAMPVVQATGEKRERVVHAELVDHPGAESSKPSASGTSSS